ncbi:MAG: AI-2E family transporter [Streptococcaceae bacterium]|jgi:predicted PurR-regulated permease PerM|nr:AI-2E family transporter [Streptococcaceae bacterium]
MRNIFKSSKLLFWLLTILLAILIIYYFNQINFVLTPLWVLMSNIFIPLIIAGFLYYVFNPMIVWLEKKIRLPRFLGSILSLLVVVGAYVGIATVIIPAIVNELTGLVNSAIKAYPDVKNWITDLVNSNQFKTLSDQINLSKTLNNLASSWTGILQNLLNGTTKSLGSILSVIAQIAVTLILIPIFLYYLLKDGEKMLPFIQKNVLREDKYDIARLLVKLNATLSKYVFGLAIDVLFVFVMAFIGYTIIGVPYAFLFALFAAVMNLVPYVGPYIGVIPVVLTLVWTHPITTLIAVAYVLIVQQIDGNVVYPRVVGSAVHVHPVTVMILMLLAGSLYGILGMIVAVPTYALIKEIVKFVVELYRNIVARRNVKSHIGQPRRRR